MGIKTPRQHIVTPWIKQAVRALVHEAKYLSLMSLSRPPFVSVTQAQRVAAFTVLVPDRLPAGWQQVHHCVYADRPSWSSAQVVLYYRSNIHGEQASISQVAAAGSLQHFGAMIGDESYQEVLRDGTPIKIRPADRSPHAEAHLVRYGTFAYLSSLSLTTDELLTIAASLRPGSENIAFGNY